MIAKNDSTDPVAELVRELSTPSQQLSPELIRRCRARREALTPWLLSVLREVAGSGKPLGPFSFKGRTGVHAAILLADFGVAEMARILLPYLLSESGDEYSAFVMEGVLAFGDEVLPVLAGAIADGAEDPRLRAVAISFAGSLTEAYPRYRDAVVALVRPLLGELERRSWQPMLLANYVAHILGRLDDSASLPLVRKMRDRVSPRVAENLEVWLSDGAYPQLAGELRSRPFRGAVKYYEDWVLEAVDGGLMELDDVPEGYEHLFAGLSDAMDGGFR